METSRDTFRGQDLRRASSKTRLEKASAGQAATSAASMTTSRSRAWSGSQRVQQLLGCLAAALVIANGVAGATIGPVGQQELPAGGLARSKALEAELNSILQQHEAQEANSKQLSEAIISRLMVGNLTGASALALADDLEGPQQELQQQLQQQHQQLEEAGGELFDQTTGGQPAASYSAPEALRLRKLISLLHSYEMSQMNSAGLGDQPFSQYPVLPASQAATIKRASTKVSNYLRQQQQRQASGYGRQSFDFGLGARPDSNLLRLGELAGGYMQPVSGGFGKRPTAHRYDFGLGKRVASVSLSEAPLHANKFSIFDPVPTALANPYTHHHL